MDAAPATRTRLPRAERMDQTLAAAHALFAERGFTAVTMDDVAAAVGVTKPLLYNYFGNKERLYLACLELSADALVSTVLNAVAGTSRPADALGNGIRAFFAFVEQDRSSWAVLFDETLPASGEIADEVARYREQILDAVAGASLHQFPPQQREQVRVETQALSTAILGAVEGMTRWWLRTEAISASYAAELLIATIEPGLRQVSELPDTTPGEPIP